VTTAALAEPTAPAPTHPAAHPAAKPGAGTDAGQHQQAAQDAVDANSTHLHFCVGDAAVHLTLPPLDKRAFYAGVTGAAAFGLMEWPIAALTCLGHLLSDDRRNRTVRALGDALDAAA
jgi:hypothetical protein